LRGLQEGEAVVEASYKDPMGNVFKTWFNVRSSFFPWSKDLITTNLFGNGTYTEKNHIFKPSQNGQMGWTYTDGVDFSNYKYLVIKLTHAQSCGAHLNIFTTNSIWGDGYESPSFGSKRQIVINLQEAKFTSGSRKGEPLDLKNIHIVCFWGNGQGSIVVSDMYLTNNEDYSREEDADAIEFAEAAPSKVDVYAIDGKCLRKQVGAGEALQGLPAGIYIVGDKKYILR
jgi:hypothetical protein